MIKVSMIIPTVSDEIYNNFVRSFNRSRLASDDLFEFELHPVRGEGYYGHKCNKGFKETDSDIVIFTNDDVYFTDYWDGYIPLLFIAKSTVVAQPSGAFITPSGGFDVRRFQVQRFVYREPNFFSGYHFALTRKAFEEIGEFDDRMLYYEDMDFFIRASLMFGGFALVQSENHFVLHYGSSTVRKNPKKYLEAVKTSYRMFKSKWPSFNVPLPEQILGLEE